QVDTSNVLFLCGGALVGLDKIIEARVGRSGMDFGAEIKRREERRVGDLLTMIQPEDLLKYGLIPEFVGRLPVIATLHDLDEAALVRILREPKNAIIKQYQKYFDLEKVRLKFTDDAVAAISREALKRGTGARGLVRALTDGRSVALVTDAGTPGISDPGFRLVREARAHGIPVVPVPGPSAVVAALSAAGIPADRFVFDGFLPVKPGRRLNRLKALRELETTVVLYESPYRILATLEAVGQVFGEVEFIVARELTKQFEEVVSATPAAHIERLKRAPVRGEFVLVLPGV